MPKNAPKNPEGYNDLDPTSYGSKLDWPKVREIRRRLDNGETQKSIADDFGIGPNMVSRIKLKKSWWPDPDDADLRY